MIHLPTRIESATKGMRQACVETLRLRVAFSASAGWFRDFSSPNILNAWKKVGLESKTVILRHCGPFRKIHRLEVSFNAIVQPQDDEASLSLLFG